MPEHTDTLLTQAESLTGRGIKKIMISDFFIKRPIGAINLSFGKTVWSHGRISCNAERRHHDRDHACANGDAGLDCQTKVSRHAEIFARVDSNGYAVGRFPESKRQRYLNGKIKSIVSKAKRLAIQSWNRLNVIVDSGLTRPRTARWL